MFLPYVLQAAQDVMRNEQARMLLYTYVLPVPPYQHLEVGPQWVTLDRGVFHAHAILLRYWTIGFAWNHFALL
jgi:hypothetical protein